jgi:hypothetical protein
MERAMNVEIKHNCGGVALTVPENSRTHVYLLNGTPVTLHCSSCGQAAKNDSLQIESRVS